MAALGLPWRPGVRKVVVAIGDAPGKDPEPGTGFTLATVRQKALSVDPAQVYTIVTGADSSAVAFMTDLANATGGTVAPSSKSPEFVATLKSTIVAAGSAPTADVGGPYSGIVGDPVALSGGGSRSEAENIVAYDWDFDGDGVYDATTTDPIVEHAYPSAGTYNLVMRARNGSGLAGTADHGHDRRRAGRTEQARGPGRRYR